MREGRVHVRSELHRYIIGCHLCVVFLLDSYTGHGLSNPLRLKVQGGRDGLTQDHLGLFSYLAAVNATSQMPGTELVGADSVVQILKAVAHLVLNHRQLGLLEKAGSESPCDDQ